MPVVKREPRISGASRRWRVITLIALLCVPGCFCTRIRDTVVIRGVLVDAVTQHGLSGVGLILFSRTEGVITGVGGQRSFAEGLIDADGRFEIVIGAGLVGPRCAPSLRGDTIIPFPDQIELRVVREACEVVVITDVAPSNVVGETTAREPIIELPESISIPSCDTSQDTSP